MSLVSVDTIVWSQTGAALAFTALKQAAAGAAGPLNLCTVDLFTAAINPTPQNVLADFVLASVAGPPFAWAEYVQKATTGWGATRTGTDGRVSADATPLLEWVGPAAGGGGSVQGYVVQKAGGGLLYSAKFLAPFPVVNNQAVCDVVCTFVFPNLQ